MGSVPRPLLFGVAAVLGLLALAGFGLGFSQTGPRKAAVEAEEAPIVAGLPASSTIQDAQALVEPPPPAPKPRPDRLAAASDAAADAAASPLVKAGPPPLPPTAEAAPGAPEGLPAPPPPKLPADLPPT